MVFLVTKTLSVQCVVNRFGLAYVGFDGGGDTFSTSCANLFFRMEDNSGCSDKEIQLILQKKLNLHLRCS